MKINARLLLCALCLSACFKRGGSREGDSTETTTQVPTVVLDAGAPAMPAPIAPIPIALTADAGAVPAMPVAAGPNAMGNAADSAVAPGAVEPSAPPPAAPVRAPAPTVAQPAPAETAQPAPGTAARPSSTGSGNRNTEVVNVPGVGAVRVREGRDNTTVNVGGIRINLPR